MKVSSNSVVVLGTLEHLSARLPEVDLLEYAEADNEADAIWVRIDKGEAEAETEPEAWCKAGLVELYKIFSLGTVLKTTTFDVKIPPISSTKSGILCKDYGPDPNFGGGGYGREIGGGGAFGNYGGHIIMISLIVMTMIHLS